MRRASVSLAALAVAAVAALALATLAGAPVARADALGGCPAGQHFVENPVPPGAMHHSGGQCVADAPPPGHCQVVAPGGSAPYATLLALGGLSLAFALSRRRAR